VAANDASLMSYSLARWLLRGIYDAYHDSSARACCYPASRAMSPSVENHHVVPRVAPSQSTTTLGSSAAVPFASSRRATRKTASIQGGMLGGCNDGGLFDARKKHS